MLTIRGRLVAAATATLTSFRSRSLVSCSSHSPAHPRETPTPTSVTDRSKSFSSHASPIHQFTTADAVWHTGRHTATKDCPLEYTLDRYGGVIVDLTAVKAKTEEYMQLFEKCLKFWKKKGFKNAVWLKIPAHNSELIPLFMKRFNFRMHHAEPEYIMLTLWQPDPHGPNPLPGSATHNVGVGVLLLTADRKVLLVQEQRGPAAARKVWKPVTGLVDVGEDITTACLRELKEEAGIEGATFDRVLAIRQSHGGQPVTGGKSDVLFMCLLRSEKTAEQIQVHAADGELADFTFVPADKVAEKIKTRPHTIWHQLYAEALPKAAKESPEHREGMWVEELPAGFKPGNQLLLMATDPNKRKSNL